MGEKRTSGLGIASLILGIIGMLLSFIAIGIFPCVISLILAIIGILNKKTKHGTCIAGIVCSAIGIGIFAIIISFIGAFDSSTNSNTVTTSTNSEVINNSETQNNSEFSENDFETKGYLYENTIGDTIYFLSIKNNSNQTIKVSGNATAYDGNQNAIGADSSDLYALGTGEEQILCFYFDSVVGVENVEYTLDYKNDNIFKSAIPYLEIQESINDKNIVISVTNLGSYPASFVEAYALFLDNNGNVVNYNSVYIVDDDSEIKSGATISEQITSYEYFSEVKTFYSGRY